MLNVRKLIQMVRAQPMLYNRSHADYKNVRTKDKIWKEIATELKTTVDVVKKKWKNLRDAYAKYLKNLINGEKKKNYLHWQWTPLMEYFRPFIGIGTELGTDFQSNIFLEIQNINNADSEASNSNLADPLVESEDLYENEDSASGAEEDVESKTGISKTEYSHHSPAIFNNNKQGKIVRVTYNNIPDDTVSSQEVEQTGSAAQIHIENDATSQNYKRKTYDNMDAIEHIFLGYAMTVKQFSRKRQAITKLKIAEIIMAQEIAHQEEGHC